MKFKPLIALLYLGVKGKERDRMEYHPCLEEIIEVASELKDIVQHLNSIKTEAGHVIDRKGIFSDNSSDVKEFHLLIETPFADIQRDAG